MFSVYFAGELFPAKHLIGNAMLANAIARRSQRRFVCVLPQALEQRQNEPKELAEPVYRWISQMPGFESAESPERVLAILEQKRSRQLLR
jgi:hypothetical protein